MCGGAARRRPGQTEPAVPGGGQRGCPARLAGHQGTGRALADRAAAPKGPRRLLLSASGAARLTHPPRRLPAERQGSQTRSLGVPQPGSPAARPSPAAAADSAARQWQWSCRAKGRGAGAQPQKPGGGHTQPPTSWPHASERPGPQIPACLLGAPPTARPVPGTPTALLAGRPPRASALPN